MTRKRNPARTPSILQLEAAECGAACLAMVLGYFDRFMPLDSLRQLCGVSRDGAKASSILKAARSFGLVATGLHAEPWHLADLAPPMIVFVNFNHFVVVEGIVGDTIYINDPASGRRREPLTTFSDSYTGVVLTFEKGPDFKPGDTRPSLFRSLVRRFDGFRATLFTVFLTSLILVIPGIAVPVFVQTFVDNVIQNARVDWLVPIILGMGLTAAVRFGLALLQGLVLLRLEEELTLTTGRTLFWKLVRLPISFYEQRFSGEIAGRFHLNERLIQLMTGQLTIAAVNAITATLFLAAMLYYDVKLALAVVALVVLNLAILTVSTRILSEQYRVLSIEDGKLQGAWVAGLRDIETFKASGAEELLFSRWTGLLVRKLNIAQKHARIYAWTAPLPALVAALVTVTVLVAGGFSVMAGGFSFGQLVAFQSLSASFMAPVMALAGFAAEILEVRTYTDRIDDVLAQSMDHRFSDQDQPAPLPKGEVKLTDVSFGYAPLEPPLIDGLELTLPPGARVALVGPSGSGKSSVGKLVTGLVAPRLGAVRLDGTEIAEWPRHLLAKSLSYVRQDVVLFEGTIRENLTLWDNTVTDADLFEATRDACIHDVIAARPGGFDAIVAQDGANFSGGERQRIEIARALALKPSVIVLDEATSALDPATELEVMEAFRRREMTCLLIAHRLSAIRDCDEIIVLDQGKVIERGTYSQLVEADGLFASLVEV